MSDISLLDRITIQIGQLESALTQLDSALVLEPTDIHKDASIQRFEFTYELAWHLLQKCLQYQGHEATSPRQIFRLGGEVGFIENVSEWITFLESRNLTTHIYDRLIADEVYAKLTNFSRATHQLLMNIKRKVTN